MGKEGEIVTEGGNETERGGRDREKERVGEEEERERSN